jgi:selenium metabolism protein YedF
MEYIDLKGMSCPLPVIETKRLIEAGSVEELEVSLDQGPARENVTRFLESRGYRVSVESDQPDSVVLHATKVEGAQTTATQVVGVPKIVVLVDGVTVGRGDELLGSVLMKSFLHTLKEIEPRPWRLIFLNAGVKLASEGSDLVAVLRELEDLGVEILSCGTCLDFFKLKEKLAVGRGTNMYDIVSSLVVATSVLRP